MPLQQLAPGQANPEAIINEISRTLDHQAVYGVRPAATSGLTWGYYGGRWGGIAITDGAVKLEPGKTNFISVKRSDGSVDVSSVATRWDSPDYARVYRIVAGGASVVSVEDHRAGPGGVHGVGVTSVAWIPQVSKSADYTLAASDSGRHIYHPAADAARAWTIPSNAAVPLPIGTTITIVNAGSAITLSITADTLIQAGTGATGTRTLAQRAVATLIKTGATEWWIYGTGVS